MEHQVQTCHNVDLTMSVVKNLFLNNTKYGDFVKLRFLTSYWVMLTWPVLGKAFQQRWLICVWQKIFLLEDI